AGDHRAEPLVSPGVAGQVRGRRAARGHRSVAGAVPRGAGRPAGPARGRRGVPPRARRLRGAAAGRHGAGAGDGGVRAAGGADDRGAGAQAGVPAAVPEGIRAPGGPGGEAAGGDAAGGADQVGGTLQAVGLASPAKRGIYSPRARTRPGRILRCAREDRSPADGGAPDDDMLTIDVVTLFPEVLAPFTSASIPGRAAAAGLVAFNLVQLRDFTHDRHATVDDYAYGGGAGMVLKPEPFFEAVESLRPTGAIVLLSARGPRFSHDDAVRFSLGERLTLLCGHYKDVDQRVAERLATEELSVGDFVLSGGEPAAVCILDAVVRLLPGALGDHESASGDSHYDGLLSPPSYTRPSEYRGLPVPEVLLSGNHARIAEWREAEAERLTRERRPDLWERYAGS